MKPITLKHPIDAHGEKITEIKLGELEVGALEGIELEIRGNGSVKIDLACVHLLLANAAQIPPSAAKKIKISDVMQLAEAFQELLGEFLPTSAN